MRLSSSFVAPSFVAPSIAASTSIAVLSIALLCGPAAAQPTPEPAAPLPAITVEAPKPVAKPFRLRQTTSTAPARRASSTAQGRPSSDGARSAAARTPAPAPDSPLGRIAKLEKSASSCNGGCETSFKSGNQPWVGCSESGGYFSTFSATCRDTLTYTSYNECKDTKVFLGLDRNRAWWFCTSMSAGNKFKVAELKRPRRAR